MYTVIETHVFKRSADLIWSEDQRLQFVEWLANNALVGDVVPGAGGLRKVRWGRTGMRIILLRALMWLLPPVIKQRLRVLPSVAWTVLRRLH